MMESFIPFNAFLGVRVTSVSASSVVMEIPFRDVLVGDPLRPALHGGVLSALADTCGGAAVWVAVKNPHARISTIDLRVDYLRPAGLDTLIAEAHVVRLGNRVGVADVRLFSAGAPDVSVATGKGVYNVSVGKTATLPA
jgi:uncharacterized protein (TIGR00369 family)